MTNARNASKIHLRPIAALALLALGARDTRAQVPRAVATGVEMFATPYFSSSLSNKLRFSRGTYSAAQDVTAFTSGVGQLRDVDAAQVDDCSLHFVAVDASGGMWHSIRSKNSRTEVASFQRFGNVKQANGNPSVSFTKACVATTGTGDLHVLGVTSTGQLLHTIRFSNGGWQSYFGNVLAVIGNSANVGTVTSVACDGNYLTGLQVAVTTSRGDAFRTTRSSDGQWDPWESITNRAGNPGRLTDVAVSNNESKVHFVLVANTGRVFHTIRTPIRNPLSGNIWWFWQPMGDVTGETGLTQTAGSVATSIGSDGLNVTIVTAYLQVLNAVRKPDGSWIGFRPAGGSWTGTSIGTAEYVDACFPVL